MKWGKKQSVFLLAALAALLAILFLVITLYEPKQPELSYWAKVEGKVNPDRPDIDLAKRPTFVRVVQYPNNHNYLCRYAGILQDPVKIDWENNGSVGYYGFSVELPIDTRITITTDCSSCYPVDLATTRNQNFYYQNLSWSDKSCNQRDIEEYTDYKEAFRRAYTLLGFVSADKEQMFNTYGCTNSTNIKLANDNLQDGWSLISEVDYGDLNQTLIKSYQAIFYGWKAHSNLERAKLENCVLKFKDLIISSEGCYQTSNEDLAIFKSSNNTYYQYSYEYKSDGYNEQNLDKVKDDLSFIKGRRDSIMDAERECTVALSKVEREYEEASKTCNLIKTKNASKNFVGGGLLAALVALILSLYKTISSYISQTSLVKWLIKMFNRFFKQNLTQQSPTQIGDGTQKTYNAGDKVIDKSLNIEGRVLQDGSGNQIFGNASIYTKNVTYSDGKTKKKKIKKK